MKFDSEYLNECFQYLPTGVLKWKKRPRQHFTSLSATMNWNARFAGHDVGIPDANDFIGVNLGSRRYGVHRLTWLMFGYPDSKLNHRNGYRADNRIENLTKESINLVRTSRYKPGTPIGITKEVFTVEKEIHHPNNITILPGIYPRYGVYAGEHIFIYCNDPETAAEWLVEYIRTMEVRLGQVTSDCHDAVAVYKDELKGRK